MTNIYPNVKAKSFWERLKIAWRIVRYGEYFPAPMPWYAPLYELTSGRWSAEVERAVDKSERGFAHTEATRAVRRQEAVQWAGHYAKEAGLHGDIQPWAINFLIEWWVARKKGRF